MSRHPSTARPRLTLRIDLVSGDEPPWRTLSIEPWLGLSAVAEAIILAFGWTGAGSWRFGTSHTPWWGRDADAWGCGILTPARPTPARTHGSGGDYGGDGYRGFDPYGADADVDVERGHRACGREWSLAEIVDRLGGELEFEYRQSDLDVAAGPGRTGPAWRHRIVAGEPDAASTESSAPSVVVLGGAGTIPRVGTEAAYGELGDPEHRAALDHEFAVRFGSSFPRGSGPHRPGWSTLDHALSGSSDAARRALRMDLIELGAHTAQDLDTAEVERTMAEIRDLLGAAAQPDGIDAASAGPLGEDLKALRFARVQKDRFRTLVAVRDTLVGDAVALWHELAGRLMHDAGAYRGRSDVAERAIDLICGDHDVRRFAFDEAHGRSWYSGRSGDTPLIRTNRILTAIGLTDADGRVIHPNARAFGLAMLER